MAAAALPPSPATSTVAFGATAVLHHARAASAATPPSIRRELSLPHRYFPQRQCVVPQRVTASSQQASQNSHRKNGNENRRQTVPLASFGQSPSSIQNSSISPPNSSLASLHELTERIADLLHVGSLQDHSTRDLLCPKDAPVNGPLHETAKNNVVVVFSKPLIDDNLTVESGKRIVTLVKQLATGALKPTIICFTGGPGQDSTSGSVSEAAASYLFFRSLCDEIGFDARQYDFIIEEESHNTKESMENSLHQLRCRYGADAVAKSHFTLVSSDYHLFRIQEVHRICPRHSLLFALDVASASWNCIFAAYPFCVSSNPATAFLGRAVVLANDLSIVLANLNGVVNDRQFFARENIARLNETFAKMRDMFRVVDSIRVDSHRGFRVDVRAHSETLELAIHRVREVQTLTSSLADPCSFVSRSDLVHAQSLLTDAVRDMRQSLDPDRPMRISDRADILDDLVAFVHKRGGVVSKDFLRENENTRRLLHRLTLESTEADTTSFTKRRTSITGPPALRPMKRIARDGPHLILVECESHHKPSTEVGALDSSASVPLYQETPRLVTENSGIVNADNSKTRGSCDSTSVKTRRRKQPAASSKAKSSGTALKSSSRPATRRKTPSRRSTTKEAAETS